MPYDLMSFATLTEALYQAHHEVAERCADSGHELMQRRVQTGCTFWCLLYMNATVP